MISRNAIILLKKHIFYISYYLSIKEMKFPQFLNLYDLNFIFKSIFLSESDSLSVGTVSFTRPCSLFHVEVETE
jgi:hypothetical protein